MTKHFCDSCTKEITGEAVSLKIEGVLTSAQIRKPLMLCPECEQQVHYAIHNRILEMAGK